MKAIVSDKLYDTKTSKDISKSLAKWKKRRGYRYVDVKTNT